MSKALESWRYQDPAKVYERMQSQRRRNRAKKTKSEVAREELERLFKEKPDDNQSR